jgi:DNA-binding MarR family transcriptional regulator
MGKARCFIASSSYFSRARVEGLPPTELGILQTLETEKHAMYAGDIAAELDKSYQFVGKRGKTLAERGLVKRGSNNQGRRTFEITPLAQASYFSPTPGDVLDVARIPLTSISHSRRSGE